MSDHDPLTFERLPVLMMSGAASSDELLDRLSNLVDALCDDLLGQQGLTPEQVTGLYRAKRRVPGALSAYRRWISLFGWPEEQTQNALFLLATMADNLLSLGALAMRDPRSAEIVESIMAGGSAGGKKGAIKRRKKTEAWKAIADMEIVRIRREKGHQSQEKLADDILFGWPDDDPPGHQSLRKHISAFDKATRISPGNEGGSGR